VLLERETLGAGSTGRAAGGIRAQFSDELNIRIALECIRRFERFAEEPGGEIDFKQWGYLFLLREEEVPAFRASVELQNRLGAPSRFVDAADVVPQLVLDDVAAATFCPIDGYATPEAVVSGYAAGAARRGVRLVQGCSVLRVAREHGAVAGVVTERGPIRARRVVCAAGVWSRELAATAGVDLPVEPERRHVWVTQPGDPLPQRLPLVIDFATGFYVHREGEALLFGGREESLEQLAPVALRRLPALAELGIRTTWSGLYELSPDRNALVGMTADPEGFLYATGFSGHGFQQGPVIGDELARLALGLPPAIDLSPFALERFARAARRQELNVV
jgi:sarcosine oxidase subunit beta